MGQAGFLTVIQNKGSKNVLKGVLVNGHFHRVIFFPTSRDKV